MREPNVRHLDAERQLERDDRRDQLVFFEVARTGEERDLQRPIAPRALHAPVTPQPIIELAQKAATFYA